MILTSTLLLLSLLVMFDSSNCRKSSADNVILPNNSNISEQIINNRSDCPPQKVRESGSSKTTRKSNSRRGNEKLITKLFNSYVKEAMPERPVIVHFDMLLLKLKASVEKDGIFESVVGLFIEWQDKRMSWNPEDFDNLTLLMFDADRIWLPDIAMTNSADHLYAIIRDTKFVVRVSYDGIFKFVPTGTARTWCDLKLLTFPFDFQTCTLEFESWSMNISTMTFDWQSQLLLDSQFSSTEWYLCQYRATTYDHTYEFTNETFTRIEFEFIVKRKSTFYVMNLIFPVFLISSTDTTADRIGFGTTNLLTLVVFQTIVTAEMPKTSDAVTALSKYIIALIMISTVGIFESIIVERMLSTGLRPPRRFLLRCLRFVPVLWREKPDPLSRLKKNTSETRGCLHGSSRLATIVNGRRSTILSGVLSRRSASLIGAMSASTESLAVNCDDAILWVEQNNNQYQNNDDFKEKDKIMEKNVVEQARNALMWTEVAYKIDFLTFISCASLALFIPLGLFIPLSLVTEQCADNARDFKNPDNII